jgi:uncharacterized protein YndB with AHSA1/START domain
MPTLTCSRTIAAPPARVFDVFTDLRNGAGRVRAIKNIEVLTDGPIRKGTRFRETRKMFSREATETMEFTDFQPGRTYTLGADSCGARFETTFNFTPECSGTRVEMIIRVQATTFFAKLFSPLSRLMMKAMRKCFEADLSDLQAAAEEGTPPGAAPIPQPG